MTVHSMLSTPDFHEEVRKGKRVLSYSQISTFLSCRHKWFLAYYLGVHARSHGFPLVLGDLVHQALAEWHVNKTPAEEFIQRYIEENILAYNNAPESTSKVTRLLESADNLADIADRLANQSIHAINLAIREFERHTWLPAQINENIPGVEIELRTEIPTAPAFEYFASHLDLIAHEQQTGRLWYVDYKIRKAFSTGAFEAVNLQGIIYAYMCRIHGIPISGTATMEIKSEPPVDPVLNKDGSMSRARIATTWEHYKRCLEMNWLDPADYAEMEYKLTTPFVRLTVEHRPPDMLEKAWYKVVLPTAELISHCIEELDNVGFSPSISRSLGHFQCNGCSVRDVCLAGLYDRDVTSILASYEHDAGKIDRLVQKGML